MRKFKRVYTTLKALCILKVYTLSEKTYKNTGFHADDIRTAKPLIYKLSAAFSAKEIADYIYNTTVFEKLMNTL